MKPRLWPNATPMRCETPISNAGRNAVLNEQLKGVSAFCTDVGLNYYGLIDGLEEQVARFADLLGVDQSVFDLGVIRRHDRSWSIRGERLLASSLRRRRLHVCPACIQEDINSSDLPPAASAYCRSQWLLDAIRICPDHRLELPALRLVGKHGEHDFTDRIAPYLDAPGALPRRHVPQEYRFQRYLLDRLDKKGANAGILDSLEFHVAARLCEILGLTLLFGKARKLETISHTDWLNAGELGFGYASEAGGFQSALLELQRRFEPTSKDGAYAVYGRFFQWLAIGRGDACFTPVRDLLREHIVASMPIGAGEVLLGEVVKERKVHSIRSASVEFRIPPKQLRPILRASGCLYASTNDKPDSWSLFDAKQHSVLLEDIRNAIPSSAVSTYLGTPRELVPILVEASLIKPFVRASSESGIPQHLFSPRELDCFLIKLFQRATIVNHGNQTGLVDLSTAARLAHAPILEVFELVLRSELQTLHRVAGPLSFTAILVDANEVRSFFLHDIENKYTIKEVTQKLEIDQSATRAIVRSNTILSTVLFNPKIGKNQRFFEKNHIDEFSRKYRSFISIKRHLRTNTLGAENLLSGNNVTPALTRSKAGHAFYYRSDLGSGEIKFGRSLIDGVWQDPPEGLFFLNDTQMERVNRFIPSQYRRKADRLVISGIVHVIAHGLNWEEAPKAYGSSAALLQRFTRGCRRGLFDRVFHVLADRRLMSDRIVISMAHLQAQQTASRLLSAGLFPFVSREKRFSWPKHFRPPSARKRSKKAAH
ncbi:transposase [Bosea sp. TAF32]|uniref:transposase n=1 Tax=Bosea sp. TAF32 TaxID=3237482 RepID=UPI003F934A01